MLFLKYKELFIKAIILQNNKGVPRTQSNIYDGAFFPKIVNYQSLTIFAKIFIVDVRLDYAFDHLKV